MVAVTTRPQFFEGSAVRNKEKNLLKALTNDCNPANINFKAIATQILKKRKLRQRHPFQLEQYYQRKTEDFLVNNNISSEPTHDLKMLPKQGNQFVYFLHLINGIINGIIYLIFCGDYLISKEIRV